MKTTDNNCGNLQVDEVHLSNLKMIANVSIGNLKLEDYPNLLVFPNNLNQYGDKISEKSIFSLEESTLTTGNIMGFVGVNNSEIKIQSRFAKGDDDYFLHYMLQKVFSINMFDLKHSFDKETIFDFLLYLFPYFLKKAMSQGLFKEYQNREYNNANVHGTIDVNRHIQQNIPFAGKISYRVREHSYDNNTTQLIRHTIEYIRKHLLGGNILNNDSDTQSFVSQIILATPSYSKNKRTDIINKNIKTFSHPYFIEYQYLQKICLQILRYEGLKFGEEKDKVYGLLFDGAWLWEEYLYTVLKNAGFIHPENNSSKKPIYLFDNPKKYSRYPDFWKDNFILDAKYKRLSATHDEKIDRDDMHQIISYMYVKCANLGGLIFPSEDEFLGTNAVSIGKLNGYGGEFKLWSVYIPKTDGTYSDYCNLMKQNEKKILKLIEN
mgnify:CR=1 FL=1